MSKTEVRKSDFLGEQYSKITHDSGLEIYVFPKDLTTSFAIFGTKYGSIDNKFRLKGEDEYTEVPNGIAHFLEHKLFDNENGEDTFSRYAKTGANANAYTSFNKTAYLFSSTDNFYESLEILLDFVSGPYFTEQSVQKEQGIIGQEIRMVEDRPSSVLFYNLLDCLYENHPVKINIAGTVGSISEINADLLYRCYNTFYAPHNMVLAVCGDVCVDKVLELVDRIVAPKEKTEIERCYASEKPEAVKKKKSVKRQVSKPLFDIGIKDTDIPSEPELRMKKAAGMAVLGEILLSRSSEFYNDLYNEGLLSNNFDYGYEINDSFAFYEISGDSQQPDAIYDRFVKYIERVKKEGIPEEEFERCRRVIFSDYIRSFDDSEEIAGNLLSFAFEGSELFEYGDIIKALSYEYIAELLEKCFDEKYYAISTVYPLG